MATGTSNQFRFANAASGVGMTVLDAVMADFAYADHTHDEFAVGVTLAGVQEFSCNGRLFRSSPGDIILFNPGDVHDGHPGTSAALRYSMLYLDTATFFPLMGCAADRGETEFRVEENHFRDPALKALILETARLVAGAGGSSLEYEHGLYEIAGRLARKMGIYGPAAWSRDKDALLLRVRDYIHDNIAGDISIDDLGRVANLSKFHFIRLFRSQFGMTPHRYILNHRINRVRESLAAGASASEATQEFGFFDASHMNRHFKRSYGITPGQYQRQLLK